MKLCLLYCLVKHWSRVSPWVVYFQKSVMKPPSYINLDVGADSGSWHCWWLQGTKRSLAQEKGKRLKHVVIPWTHTPILVWTLSNSPHLVKALQIWKTILFNVRLILCCTFIVVVTCKEPDTTAASEYTSQMYQGSKWVSCMYVVTRCEDPF